MHYNDLTEEYKNKFMKICYMTPCRDCLLFNYCPADLSPELIDKILTCNVNENDILKLLGE